MGGDLKNRFGGMSYEGDYREIADILTRITRLYLPKHRWAVLATSTDWEVRLVERGNPQGPISTPAENSIADTLNVAQSQALIAAFSGAGLRTSRKPNASSGIGFLIQIEESEGSGFGRKFRVCLTGVGDNAQVRKDLQQLEQIRPEIDRLLLAQMKPPQLEIDGDNVFDTTTESQVLTVQTAKSLYVIARNADNKDAPILMVKDIVTEEGCLRFSGEVLCYPGLKNRTRWKTGPIQAIAFANGLTWSAKTGWRRTGEPAAPHRKTPTAETQPRRAAPRTTETFALQRLAFAS